MAGQKRSQCSSGRLFGPSKVAYPVIRCSNESGFIESSFEHMTDVFCSKISVKTGDFSRKSSGHDSSSRTEQQRSLWQRRRRFWITNLHKNKWTRNKKRKKKKRNTFWLSYNTRQLDAYVLAVSWCFARAIPSWSTGRIQWYRWKAVVSCATWQHGFSRSGGGDVRGFWGSGSVIVSRHGRPR